MSRFRVGGRGGPEGPGRPVPGGATSQTTAKGGVPREAESASRPTSRVAASVRLHDGGRVTELAGDLLDDPISRESHAEQARESLLEHGTAMIAQVISSGGREISAGGSRVSRFYGPPTIDWILKHGIDPTNRQPFEDIRFFTAETASGTDAETDAGTDAGTGAGTGAGAVASDSIDLFCVAVGEDVTGARSPARKAFIRTYIEACKGDRAAQHLLSKLYALGIGVEASAARQRQFDQSHRAGGADAQLLSNALGKAVAWGIPGAVRALLEEGANPNLPDEHGWVALVYAINAGSERLTRLLLEGGANPELCSGRHGEPPLVVAANKGGLAVARLLLAAGADVDGTDGRGHTALMNAAGLGREEMVRMLLEEYGANANHTDARRRTALMDAARGGNVVVAELLLNHGADQSLADVRGRTAIDIARGEQSAEMVAVLTRQTQG